MRRQIRIATLFASSCRLSPEKVPAGQVLIEADVKQKCVLFVGDLGVKLTPPRSEEGDEFAHSWSIHTFSNGVKSGNDSRIFVTISGSPVARGRLVIFGDSFIAQTQTALTAYFKEIIFCRTRFFHHEIVIDARPDFVLSENVERYLSNVTPDNEAVPILLMAQMGGRVLSYEPDHALAIGALLSGYHRTYRNFIAGLDAESTA